jgi:ATP/maltotriose-dependent transcriptional regulator MalT/two-component SAPR family response regulator
MVASDIPISKTKIIVPRRREELLSRGRLLNALFDFLDRKLTMVTAPAGYGKTSLLIDLAHQNDLPFCWLALDPLDRDPQRFIAYFIAAITERFPQFGSRSRTMLNSLTSIDDGMERLLVTLVNEIFDDIHEHFVLVVDDFHLLDEVLPIHYLVNRFLQLIGENCHLVLSSRSLTELADIPLLVAREQVGGLDFSDLSFSEEEIQALLAQNQNIHLSDEDAHKLIEATEGWITGLQFTSLDLIKSGENSFRASRALGVSVFDYLGQQVLEYQSEPVKLFLLRSSMLEEFDTAMCQAILSPLYSELQDWSGLLGSIVQKNLFILPVGSEGQWLRYHHLFRDYLQQRYRKEFPEEVTPTLRRMAEYQERQGDWEKAYQLYKQLGDTLALADMIERAGIPMYQHAMLTLESWLKDLPPSIYRKRPGLLSLRGTIETIKGNAAEGAKLFDRAITTFREDQDIPGLALALVRRGNAYRFLGNYGDAIQDAEEAERISENKDDLQWIDADALRIKGLSLFRQGRSLEAISHLEKALDIYLRVNDTPSIPILMMDTGMVYSVVGSYSEAKASYEKALALWRQTGNLSWQASLLNNLGFLYYELGEHEKAVDAYEEGLLCAQRSGFKRMEVVISIGLGDLYSEIEDFEVAGHNYRQIKDSVQQLGDSFLFNYLAIVETNLALLKTDIDQARQILDQSEAAIKASNSTYEYGLYELMRGRLSLQGGKPQQAITDLTEAKRCFTQDGREMESIWSHVWLAATYCQIGDPVSAREEIKAAVPNPNQVKHPAIVAARQARDWLGNLRNDTEVKSLLRGLFEKADHLEDQLPRTRRQLRRLARTIEVPSPHLIIRAFGPGQVWVNGTPVGKAEWQTQSVRELFFYFLSEVKPLTREQIGEVLWNDTLEPPKLKLRFKNEIYRLRRAVGQDTIIFDGECYQFNRAVDHEYDIEAFDAYMAIAKNLITHDEKVNFYQKAIDLVNGRYLEDIGSTWAWPERERLNQAFLTASLALAELHYQGGLVHQALSICQRALEYDDTSEAIYRQMMQIYSRMGDKASIVHTYQACEQTLQRIFDLPPSAETKNLFRELTS